MADGRRRAPLLGLDGGGSTFRLVTAPADGSGAETAVELAGGDIGSLGASEMAHHLDRAILALCEAAGVARHEIAGAVLGVPAYGTAPQWDRSIEDAVAAALPASDVRVMNDVYLAREAAFASRAGVLALAGTGAMAWGRCDDGREARVGGWGFAFGDEGGGYDLGRRGLAAASRAEDGRGPPTDLLARSLRHFGAGEFGEIVRELTRDLSGLRRSTASFAASVLDAAEHDEVAAELVRAAAAELAQQVATARERLNAPLPVSVAGGLFRHTRYRDAFRAAARAHGLPDPVEPVESPVRAALRMARERHSAGGAS